MAKEITIHYSFSERSYSYRKSDRDFFKQFPNVKEGYRSSDGRPVRKSKADLGNYLVFFGSTVLSSAVLAAGIKAWIEGRRRKVVISINRSDRKVEYEGPSLAHDLKEIESIIDKLADESSDQHLLIQAYESPEEEPGQPVQQ